MSYWISTVVENVLWLGASVVALILFVALAVLERVDAIAERARTARRERPGAARPTSPVLH